MNRLLGAAIILVVLVPACGTQERPEGIVERWLESIDRGPAGRPERWTVEARLTDAVFPTRLIEAGAFDEILVGEATPIGDRSARVPYAVVFELGGRDVRFWGAVIVRDTAAGPRIARFESTYTGEPDPGWTESSTIAASPFDWSMASALAATLVGLSMLLMRLAKPSDPASQASV